MPTAKPQGNYLPFFGPYNRDWSTDDEPQFRTLLYRPRKNESLARLLQMGPMLPPRGTNDDLRNGFFYTAAKNTPRLSPRSSARN